MKMRENELDSPDQSECEYIFDEGLLKVVRKGRKLVAVPGHLHSTIVAEFHDKLSLHAGVTKTLNLILQKYHLDGITSTVKSYIKSCKYCAEHKKPSNNVKPGLIKAIGASHCLEAITADILGPLTLLDEQQRPYTYYVHIIVDNFSKFLFTELIRDTKADTIIECFEDVFNVVGLCQKVYSDRASYYTSTQFEEFRQRCQFEHVMPPPNCPFVVGQAESFVKEVKLRLKFALDTKRSHWKRHLAEVTKVINSTYREGLDTSAFEVLYGFLPRTCLDNVIGSQASQSTGSFERDRIELREKALSKLNRHRERYVKYSNKNRSEVQYFPGQEVYIFERHISSKLARAVPPHWKGPFTAVSYTHLTLPTKRIV